MILDKEIEISVNNQQLLHYINLGYKAEYRKILKVKPLDLTIGSHCKVNVACDICHDKSVVEFRQLKGREDYLCNSCAAKNKKKKIYTEEEKKDMIDKMLKTIENKILDNPNYKKNKIDKMLKTKIINNKNYLSNAKKDKTKTKIKKTKDQITEIINKRKLTKLIKYGNETFNNQSKKNITLKEKYGNEFYNNTEKRKSTLEFKYGDKSFNNQVKKELTCLKKYGVRHTNQVLNILKKIQKSAFKLKYHENCKLNYRGSYEKDFLDFCFDNDINISEFSGLLFYSINDKKHRYFPDFYHKESNTIIEIKSSYTMNYNLNINYLKRNCAISNNYNFLFIIDKDYNEFVSIL